jgi:predicted RNA binding protein YcfA (HicA-like mRNA interferase family)/predicted RNase H-like HicB family nuclease
MPTKKVREVLEMLEQDGWYLVTMRGSHRQFKHPSELGRVTVAGKPSDDMAPGTLNSIPQASGTEGDALMRYAIVIERANSNFSAYVPDLPGCVATGDTVEDVEIEIGDAIRLHIEGLLEDGLPVPQPTAIAEYVEA